jgi:predicted DCC family thiol-disulfide oxidoreductase YuxK
MEANVALTTRCAMAAIIKCNTAVTGLSAIIRITQALACISWRIGECLSLWKKTF